MHAIKGGKFILNLVLYHLKSGRWRKVYLMLLISIMTFAVVPQAGAQDVKKDSTPADALLAQTPWTGDFDEMA